MFDIKNYQLVFYKISPKVEWYFLKKGKYLIGSCMVFDGFVIANDQAYWNLGIMFVLEIKLKIIKEKNYV